MLTLYHAPHSRSTRIVRLLYEMSVEDEVEIRRVEVPRADGSGRVDPQNPHPEGKVPVLVHDGALIWESNAIILYLTDLFPKSGLGPAVGAADRGAYLSWLAYYGNVVEPVLIHTMTGLQHPVLQASFRGMTELTSRISGALQDRPYLLGEAFSAADLLVTSPFVWMPDATPDDSAIRDWVRRCSERPAQERVAEYDGALSADTA
ncbi:glutathione S-transferase family protein [Sulfitobacter sp. D35]|uniref:glutathione S-transferase family protein n=1 Tax=Sulfitobacter sp. D35 TaxID=3083252 RepID=UPI00296FF848|nr:glutathione S-transferase family protein [Sulfitobacter sp. D35]MDW4498015.1 glutathione S-transferase family protein [Sulfitobacter sp. D35]